MKLNWKQPMVRRLEVHWQPPVQCYRRRFVICSGSNCCAATWFHLVNHVLVAQYCGADRTNCLLGVEEPHQNLKLKRTDCLEALSWYDHFLEPERRTMPLPLTWLVLLLSILHMLESLNFFHSHVHLFLILFSGQIVGTDCVALSWIWICTPHCRIHSYH